jgi:hypothetical protein
MSKIRGNFFKYYIEAGEVLELYLFKSILDKVSLSRVKNGS